MESKTHFVPVATRSYPAWFETMRTESPNFFNEIIASSANLASVNMQQLTYDGSPASLDHIVDRVLLDLQRQPDAEIVLAAKTTGLALTLFRQVLERLFVRRPDLRPTVIKHNHNQAWLAQQPAADGTLRSGKIIAMARHTSRGRWFGVSSNSIYVIRSQ